MRVIYPFDINNDNYLASSLREDDYNEWVDATDYEIGDRVVILSSHQIWECIEPHTSFEGYTIEVTDDMGDRMDMNVTIAGVPNPIATDDFLKANPDRADRVTVYWKYIGATTKWRLFDERPTQIAGVIPVGGSYGSREAGQDFNILSGSVQYISSTVVDNRYIYTTVGRTPADRRIYVYDLDNNGDRVTGREFLRVGTSNFAGIAWDANSRILYIGNTTGPIERRRIAADGAVTTLTDAFSPTGFNATGFDVYNGVIYLISGSSCRAYDLSDGMQLFQSSLNSENDNARDIAISPDGTALISDQTDNKVYAYTVSRSGIVYNGDNDFDLDTDNAGADSIALSDEYIYVADVLDDKFFGYGLPDFGVRNVPITLTLQMDSPATSIAFLNLSHVMSIRVEHKRGAATISNNTYDNTDSEWQRNAQAETNFPDRYRPNLIVPSAFSNAQADDTVEITINDGRPAGSAFDAVQFGVGQVVLGNMLAYGDSIPDDTGIDFLDFSQIKFDDENFIDVDKQEGTTVHRLSSIMPFTDANNVLNMFELLRGGNPAIFMDDTGSVDKISAIYAYLKDGKLRFRGDTLARLRLLVQGLI